jgi:hypothetical protein
MITPLPWAPIVKMTGNLRAERGDAEGRRK